jgi:hypothetical protein
LTSNLNGFGEVSTLLLSVDGCFGDFSVDMNSLWDLHPGTRPTSLRMRELALWCQSSSAMCFIRWSVSPVFRRDVHWLVAIGHVSETYETCWNIFKIWKVGKILKSYKIMISWKPTPKRQIFKWDVIAAAKLL